MEYLKKLNEIIFNTFDLYKDNYFNSININKILHNYYKNKIYTNDLLNEEYVNIKKLNFENSVDNDNDNDNNNENDINSENENKKDDLKIDENNEIIEPKFEENNEDENENEINQEKKKIDKIYSLYEREIDEINDKYDQLIFGWDDNTAKKKIMNKIENYNYGIYEDKLINDKKEGKGILFFNDETRFEGEFINDKIEGGIYYFNNEDKFEGEFKNDLVEGKGIYYFNDGSVYEDEFKIEELLNNEDEYLFDPEYMSSQKDLNEKMRAILINWLMAVHNKYNFIPQTMYISVDLIDRYLSMVIANRNNLQLIGIASMIIACKYEELYSPPLDEFVDLTDNAYDKSDAVKMISKIHRKLNFEVDFPTQWNYFVSFKRKLDLDEKTFYLAWFLMELCLIDYQILRFRKSIIAASSILIASKNTGVYKNNWLKDIIGIDEKDLEECCKEIYEFYDYNSTDDLQEIRRKFSSSKFGEVAKIKLCSYADAIFKKFEEVFIIN